MLWIALAVMTGLAMGFALWPLAFRRSDDAGAGREAAFYRAQLAEIERDVERGQLPPDEAASARAEAGRRLIAASDGAALAPASGGLRRRRAAAIAAFVIVPAVALAVYVKVGEPDLPDEPLASRKPDLNAEGGLDAAVAMIEARLTRTPDDRRGWELLAPLYMRMGRFADAADAYRRILQLGGASPAIYADFGEALTAVADSVVTAEARAQFEKAPNLPMTQFYLALAAEQEGKTAQALAAYKALAPQATGRMPWMVGLRARLAALSGDAQKPAAPQFSADQRQMIEGMVSGLADRLASKGGGAEEWGRLIRAYSVLHEPDKAREALASAHKALGPNADIDALARELGI